MNYSYTAMFLIMTVCATVHAADQNPYADLTKLSLILARTAQQEIGRKKTRETQVAQIIAKAKAAYKQKKLELLFDSWCSSYCLRHHFRPKQPTIPQKN